MTAQKISDSQIAVLQTVLHTCKNHRTSGPDDRVGVI